ncbi:amino acid permease [Variovorax dokdonensis]|uniref:Amino acid permease n=1 Tax=Variovorax dokdonensis TaxID=344883 RepID=A0ABT7N5C4_9BURK|nr:amino acid permease [Variovorax dokdonensis]MDM0043151.1 amino acid permease [Variovorax dokdonensis]
MSGSQYTARKSVADIVASGEAGEHKLTKSLGAFSITALGVGAIIGAGIFVLTGSAAARYAGPGVMLSFVLAGLACAFVGLCYAELSALIPVSGSSYTYSYATLGELTAWIIGWDLVLEYAMGSATVAVGWSGYLVSLLGQFGVHLPPELVNAPGLVTLADGSTVQALFNVPAAAIVLLITMMLVLGTKESARLNNLMVVIKLVVVLAFIGFGIGMVNLDNWVPFVPENTGTFGEFGVSGVLRASSVVFFAFIGFDAVSTAAQEARNPQRDMPLGILGSLLVCTLLYVAVAAVLTGLVPYQKLGVPDPIAVGVEAIGKPWLSLLIKFGALAGLTTVILVLLYGQSRIFFTIARDGLLPPVFSRVHKSTGTPHLSLIIVGILVSLAAGLMPIHLLGEMVSIGTLFAFILVCGAVLYLRRAESEVFRPFRVPGVPIIPVVGIALCLLLMAGLPMDTWIRLFVWLAIGLVIYFGYGRHHSTLGKRMRAAGKTK